MMIKPLRAQSSKKLSGYFPAAIIYLLFFVTPLPASALNSATITAATLQALPHCVHYQVRGVCYWQDWHGINTTLYVEQYLPDLVVVVFNQPGDDPWLELQQTLDRAGQLAQKTVVPALTGFTAGAGQQSFADMHEQAVFFKEAEVIGNPTLAVLPHAIFLPSTAQPLLPYYQSLLDSVLWRGLPLAGQLPPEELYAVGADLVHHVGTTGLNWGGIYPHEGKVVSSNDAKAAAVIAQRAADLVTAINPIITGHVYHRLGVQCGEECTATPLQENSSNTQFQLIYPKVETTCDYFGKTLTYGEDFEQQAKGAYAWVVWRFYHGCIPGDGQYIGKLIAG